MKSDGKFIVITSIFPPTRSIDVLSSLDDWQVIVVGDKKTPSVWNCKNVIFLSIDDQIRLGYRVTEQLPYNHYSRKIIGYIYAIKMGAKIIVDTDDDNVPKSNWGFPEFNGQFLSSSDNLKFINIYKYFTNNFIWPRGFPLNYINSKRSVLEETQLSKRNIAIGVWQGLADRDPDVDAIYRLLDNRPCNFFEREPVVLGKGTVCPFNSQNTAFCKELFPLLYLPSFVSFRFTDILRGLLAQPIMWSNGFRLGFTRPTVTQNRNEHDFLKDFESEIPCYLLSEKILDIVSKAVDSECTLDENLVRAYAALHEHAIVTKMELRLLSLWLKDIF
ncbi:MAG: STELLO glycosyltransferase family protein [Methanothrix sp.]